MGHVLKEVMNALPPPDWRADVIVDPKLERTVVTANRECLLLAIRNLHENAVDHVPQRGMIRWSCETTHPGTTIFVEDNGPGIPEEELSSVTNRFFRGRNKSTLGSGLGLSIVDLALRTSGARLNFRNRPDARGLRAEMVWNAQSPVAGTADSQTGARVGQFNIQSTAPTGVAKGPVGGRCTWAALEHVLSKTARKAGCGCLPFHFLLTSPGPPGVDEVALARIRAILDSHRHTNALVLMCFSAFLPRFETDEFAHVDALSASIQKCADGLVHDEEAHAQTVAP